MAKKQKKDTKLEVDSYSHEKEKEKRTNNPQVGLVSSSTDKLDGRTQYKHDPYIDPALIEAGDNRGIESFVIRKLE